MSGGPELLALPADPVIGEALTSMQAYPEEWWCELQELQPKLRMAILETAVAGDRAAQDADWLLSDYDTFNYALNTRTFDEGFLRFVMGLLECGPGLHFSGPRFRLAFRLGVLNAASFQDKHRKDMVICRSQDAAPWEARPMQLLRRLAAVKVKPEPK